MEHVRKAHDPALKIEEKAPDWGSPIIVQKERNRVDVSARRLRGKDPRKSLRLRESLGRLLADESTAARRCSCIRNKLSWYRDVRVLASFAGRISPFVPKPRPRTPGFVCRSHFDSLKPNLERVLVSSARQSFNLGSWNEDSTRCPFRDGG